MTWRNRWNECWKCGDKWMSISNRRTQLCDKCKAEHTKKMFELQKKAQEKKLKEQIKKAKENECRANSKKKDSFRRREQEIKRRN